MPEYLSPGVYMEEVEIGGTPIEGVSTSTTGFAGETERGPTEATLITGLAEYQRNYGGYSWTVGEEVEDPAAAKKKADDADKANKAAATALDAATKKFNDAKAAA